MTEGTQIRTSSGRVLTVTKVDKTHAWFAETSWEYPLWDVEFHIAQGVWTVI